MKVMVIDTVGGDRFGKRYRKFFPKVKLSGYEMSNQGTCQPHGYQCGYYAGVLLNNVPGDHELIFVRNFDGRGNWVRGSEDWMLDLIEKHRPDIVTRSWGQHDGDSAYGESMGTRGWAQWAEEFKRLQGVLGFVDFGAAGNDDVNDADNDIAFPQRLMGGFSNVIGSHRRDGVPSKFSGDGHGVQCVLWGENILLNSNGIWERGSGTSFSCPKAAGLCAALGLLHEEWGEYVQENATKPEGWTGDIPHPKWGYGSLEYRYQEKLAALGMTAPHLLPPYIAPARLQAKREWFDREQVLCEKDTQRNS